MQPIIRRTITITITETWTITWSDGHETSWHKTYEVVQPAGSELGAALPPTTKTDENARIIPDLDPDDQFERDA